MGNSERSGEAAVASLAVVERLGCGLGPFPCLTFQFLKGCTPPQGTRAAPSCVVSEPPSPIRTALTGFTSWGCRRWGADSPGLVALVRVVSGRPAGARCVLAVVLVQPAARLRAPFVFVAASTSCIGREHGTRVSWLQLLDVDVTDVGMMRVRLVPWRHLTALRRGPPGRTSGWASCVVGCGSRIRGDPPLDRSGAVSLPGRSGTFSAGPPRVGAHRRGGPRLSSARMAVRSRKLTLSTTAQRISTDGSSSSPAACLVTGSSATIFLGGPDVTAETGVPLAVGESLSVDLGPGDNLWAVASTGTPTVYVMTTRTGGN